MDAKVSEPGVSPVTVESLTHKDRRLIVISMMLPVFLGSIDQSILATSLPTIGRALGDVHNLPWLITVVPDRLDGADAALRQIRRYPWPARRAVDRARRLYGGLAVGGVVDQHADADLRAHRARLRRRRPDRDLADDFGRRRRAEGSRQVLRLFLHRLYHRGRHRAGAGRLDLRSPLLVGDLSVEFSALRRRRDPDPDHAAQAAAP